MKQSKLSSQYTDLSRRTFGRIATLASLGLTSAFSATSEDSKPATSDASLQFTFIGESAYIPEIGREAASFLINGKHLVDTGWSSILRMRDYGFDPVKLESLIITHFHQDHYIGLPQLLFYEGMKRRESTPLLIAGPSEHLQSVVEAADTFLQSSRFPEVIPARRLLPLSAGDSFDAGDLHFDVFAAHHLSGKSVPEQALCYKVTHKATGACAFFTGDTHPHPPIAEYAKGASLLIFDAAHTPVTESAQIALKAGVQQLVLIHYFQNRAEHLLEEAKKIFPNTVLAQSGVTLKVKN